MAILYIVLGIVLVLILWIISLYNGLVKLNNRTKESWSDIDVQLKRRHDLIPNLINSVKGYMTHEKELLEKITKARAGAITAGEAGNITELGKLENQLSGMLGKLQVAVEAYPDLKANTNVAQLMDELSDTENKIQASRRFYNGMVRDFNTKIETFPNNVFAGMLRFTKYNFFEVEDANERKNITVNL
ncbi:MAG TPA: LemA family protein [Candidatus Magasanikbacteria bacterium]|jgi:LemA protein|nr:LemA family protein [Candidatus Magasanikbacteria bacterium]HQF56922.1 LemA family protein [Candidatus Magasanikbacteria bacterium]HQL52794.1 LemA family protein [Candidatus Magasanikbacteria bacterium]